MRVRQCHNGKANTLRYVVTYRYTKTQKVAAV